MPSEPHSSKTPRIVGLLALSVIAIIAIAFVKWSDNARKAVEKTVEQAGYAAGKVIAGVERIAEKFTKGQITTTFSERNTKVISTKGDILEVAISRSDERFYRSDTKSTFWGRLNLGTTISEITAPVTFRYYIKLSDNWNLTATGRTCVVIAPRIRPSLPPAIHTDMMEKRTEGGWARFNKGEQLDDLERSMTQTLEERAADADHIALTREHARLAVAEFVKNWLLRKNIGALTGLASLRSFLKMREASLRQNRRHTGLSQRLNFHSKESDRHTV